MIGSVFQAMVTGPVTLGFSAQCTTLGTNVAEEAYSPDGTQEAKREKGKIGPKSQSPLPGNDRNDLDPSTRPHPQNALPSPTSPTDT